MKLINKNEILEILQDYLKQNFSKEEVDDILRNYEEYFIEGTIEGKSEEEIIKLLNKFLKVLILRQMIHQ